MEKKEEILCKKALKDILTTEFSKTVFSLDGFDEDAVCLDKTNDYWEVYIGHRGQKDKRMVYDNIKDACLQVIRLLTPSNELLETKLSNMFVVAFMSI